VACPTTRPESVYELPSTHHESVSGLDLLAEAAFSLPCPAPIGASSSALSCDKIIGPDQVLDISISPIVKDVLVLPRVQGSTKSKRKTLISSLPDNLTSPECIRSMALRELEKVQAFAEREKKAKEKYMMEALKKDRSNQKKS